jgi:hypothetical protein
MKKILVFAVASMVAVVSACGSSATGPGSSIAGTYNLQTVNSAPLPFTLQDDANSRIDVLADVYVLAGDGTYTNATTERITPVGGTARVTILNQNGTYKRIGPSVSLTDAVDLTDKVSGTINGDVLSLSVTGLLLVYQRATT